MKNLLIFVTVITFSYTAAAQNCYVPLDDASGYTPTAGQLAELEAAACRLIDSLPAAFRDSFRVYDFGFYLHNETQQGGYPEAFQWAVDTVQTLSKYYLVFGKQTDQSGVYTRFWVDLKLPETGEFSCMTEIQTTLFEAILNKEANRSDNSNFVNYHMIESSIMNTVSLKVVDVKTCCMQRDASSCSQCPTAEEVSAFYTQNDYIEIPAKFLEMPSSKAQQKSSYVDDRANLYSELSGVSGFEDFSYTLEQEIVNAVNEGVNAKAYITKDENLCDQSGFDLISGFAEEAYIHLHYSPSGDSLAPGMVYLKFKTKDFVEVALPEVLITGQGNQYHCGGYPLPELHGNAEPYFDYAITNCDQTYCGYKYTNGNWVLSDTLYFFERTPSTDNDDSWADGGAYRSRRGPGFTYEYFPSFIAWIKSEWEYVSFPPSFDQ